ncbi:Co2+/Mg2+ efflux protein ApaG [Pseudovibrio sp. Tun.PSC04-5.I4]|uniref:Co2+/Mg2+ efflux protein ApaG n=1 Tax=Pseudovibrio sp. Tun.PSC04-5.I4 TaxID=1798213 RepID=UPI00088AFD6E|nr:Co2+/Mg2+ efflux protein ApaG [Pseudovibrio sp. Tun.PSC04-5.I4]SDQ83509.1 ApaG protein [Pseudovibrio sp. Tun.PSC04-5.I4]
MYRAVTRDIQITVEPYYLADESTPEDDQFFWAYTVSIENQGEKAVQLRSRHWHIIDANGHSQEVNGAGVVGEEPVIEPGNSFQYTSGCPLNTSSGIMTGNYRMQTQEGEFFAAKIPAFSLDLPDMIKTVH